MPYRLKASPAFCTTPVPFAVAAAGNATQAMKAPGVTGQVFSITNILVRLVAAQPARIFIRLTDASYSPTYQAVDVGTFNQAFNNLPVEIPIAAGSQIDVQIFNDNAGGGAALTAYVTITGVVESEADFLARSEN